LAFKLDIKKQALESAQDEWAREHAENEISWTQQEIRDLQSNLGWYKSDLDNAKNELQRL
jgi:multidrug resistance efflux pump